MVNFLKLQVATPILVGYFVFFLVFWCFVLFVSLFFSQQEVLSLPVTPRERKDQQVKVPSYPVHTGACSAYFTHWEGPCPATAAFQASGGAAPSRGKLALILTKRWAEIRHIRIWLALDFMIVLWHSSVCSNRARQKPPFFVCMSVCVYVWVYVHMGMWACVWTCRDQWLMLGALLSVYCLLSSLKVTLCHYSSESTLSSVRQSSQMCNYQEMIIMGDNCTLIKLLFIKSCLGGCFSIGTSA